MATDLRITPARRALLQAINDGAVTQYRSWGFAPSRILWNHSHDAPSVVVTKAAETLASAGLVRVPPARLGDFAPQTLELTDAGRERLGGGS